MDAVQLVLAPNRFFELGELGENELDAELDAIAEEKDGHEEEEEAPPANTEPTAAATTTTPPPAPPARSFVSVALGPENPSPSQTQQAPSQTAAVKSSLDQGWDQQHRYRSCGAWWRSLFRCLGVGRSYAKVQKEEEEQAKQPKA